MATGNDVNDARPEEAGLDRALARALAPPALPAGFRQRLAAALARESDDALVRRRVAAERERREQLAALARDSVLLRLQTLGAIVGGAFVAGAATALALPWIREAFAPHERLALVLIGAGIAVAAGIAVWNSRVGEPNWPH